MDKHSFLVRVLVNAVSIYITASIVKGFYISGFGAAIIGALVLAILNALVKPILLVLTLPINFLSLGLFTFVLNGLILMIAANVTNGIRINGIGPAIIASIIISVISAIINLFI